MPYKKNTRKRLPSSPKQSKIPKLNRFYAHPVYIENFNNNNKMRASENIIPGEIVCKFGYNIIAFTTNKMSHMAIDALPSVWKQTVGAADPDKTQQKEMIRLVETNGIGLSGPNNMKILMCNSYPQVPHNENVGHFVNEAISAPFLEKLGNDKVSSVDVAKYWINSKPNCMIIRNVKNVIKVIELEGLVPLYYDFKVEHDNAAIASIRSIDINDTITISKGPHVYLNKKYNMNQAERKLIDLIQFTSDLNLRRQANYFLEYLIRALRNGIPFGNIIGSDYWSIFIIIAKKANISTKSLTELKWAILTSNGAVVYWNYKDRDVFGKIEDECHNSPKNPTDFVRFTPTNSPKTLYVPIDELAYHETGLYNSLIDWNGIPPSHSLYSKDIFEVDSNKEIFNYTGRVPVLLLSDGVRSIRSETFKDCHSLAKVILPSSIKNISKRTFFNCQNLEEVVLPETLEFIDEEAFMNCPKLKIVNFHPELKIIGKRSFKNCGFTEIELYGAIIIDTQAFENNLNLEKIWIGDNIKFINSQAFLNCSKLHTFQIDDSDEEIIIKDDTFDNCNLLVNVDLPEDITIKTD